MPDLGPWTENRLDDEWGDPNQPNSTDIDNPRIIMEGDKQDGRLDGDQTGRRTVDAERDYIFVRDGGTRSIEPVSMGHLEQRREDYIDIEVETSNDREHLMGPPAAPRYEGLSGEAKRILDRYRLGVHADNDEVPDPQFDRLVVETNADVIGDRGADLWRTIFSVRFITYAEDIPQVPDIFQY